jgi:hypothetical protein
MGDDVLGGVRVLDFTTLVWGLVARRFWPTSKPQ